MEQKESLVEFNETLIPVQFSERAEEVASSVLYQETEADSSSANGWSFYVRSPAHNAMLDNEALIQYTVRVGSGGFGADFGLAKNTAADNAHLVALRQCWPITRGIQNLSCSINGVNISHQPNVWIDAMNRLFISDEESGSICSMSGGEFDSGFAYGRASDANNYTTSAVPNAALNLAHGFGGFGAADPNDLSPTFPDNPQWYNSGYTKRIHRLVQKGRDAGAANAAAGNARFGAVDYAEFVIYERIPIGPFYFYESRDVRTSIPYVQTLSLTATFVANLALSCCQGNGVPTFDITQATPKLHLKWRMAPMQLPKQISVKSPVVREYRTSKSMNCPVVASTLPITTTGVTYNNINLEGIPDLLLIYFKRQTDLAAGASEHHLGITSLELSVGGASGKLNKLSQGEMYSMYLKNTKHHGLKKIDYEQWRRYSCVAAIKPEDIGLDRGPGFDYPVQISITADAANFWVEQTIKGQGAVAIEGAANVNYWFTVIAYYDKSELILNENGGGRLRIVRV